MQWRADHELLPCDAGWRADVMILPDADDPPDMQIFKMVAMRVEATDRWFGFASLGAPAPMVARGPHFGDQHKQSQTSLLFCFLFYLEGFHCILATAFQITT